MAFGYASFQESVKLFLFFFPRRLLLVACAGESEICSVTELQRVIISRVMGAPS